VASHTAPAHLLSSTTFASSRRRAECVNEASCPAIRFVVIGGDRDPNATLPEDAGDFEDCVRACVP
jgi:hypothetical protein